MGVGQSARRTCVQSITVLNLERQTYTDTDRERHRERERDRDRDRDRVTEREIQTDREAGSQESTLLCGLIRH